jgi:tetratricopeptide (TPR) repeat protein
MKSAFAFTLSLLAALTFGGTFGQQVADPDFDTKVARPAYTKERPKILFDEAHANFHTAGDRYKPLAELLSNDGYEVTSSKEKFSSRLLGGYRILLIANALGVESLKSPEWSPNWFAAGAKSAFSEEECDAVRDWVKQGGALLLIADHRPFGAAAESLAKRFGVEMSKGYVFDTTNLNQAGVYRNDLTFTRAGGGIVDHPITRGRGEAERINRVMTFVGQSLQGPTGSKERAVGNVEEAIKLYQRVVREFGSNRSLAAKAQLRLGLLYERLGRKAEARQAFQIVLGQYSDQADVARQAQARLAALAKGDAANGKSAALSVRQVWAENAVDPLGKPMPDGKSFVFTDEDATSTDIYLWSAPEGRETLLVKHQANDFPLGWTPDGKRLLFASDRTGSIGAWKIQVANGNKLAIQSIASGEARELLIKEFFAGQHEPQIISRPETEEPIGVGFEIAFRVETEVVEREVRAWRDRPARTERAVAARSESRT